VQKMTTAQAFVLFCSFGELKFNSDHYSFINPEFLLII